MKQKLFFVVMISLMVILLTGCAGQTETPIQGGLISGVTLDKSTAGQNANFELSSKTDGQKFGLDFAGSFTEGGVSI